MFNTVYSALYEDFAHLNRHAKQCKVIDHPNELTDPDSIMILHGGEDISPSLYGQKPNKYTGAGKLPSGRDFIESSLLDRASKMGIPVLGICRGAQLACVKAGGSLVQHVDRHHSSHKINVVKDCKVSEFSTNSVHHQMMIPWNTDHTVLGWSDGVASKYLGENENPISMHLEPEIVWFNGIKTLAIQGHPEWLAYTHPLVQYMIAFLRSIQ